jgi:hypothetical protein
MASSNRDQMNPTNLYDRRFLNQPEAYRGNQINAVRAASKAGVKPSLIARQFGLSQSDIRKVLAMDTAERGIID